MVISKTFDIWKDSLWLDLFSNTIFTTISSFSVALRSGSLSFSFYGAGDLVHCQEGHQM